MTVWPPRSSESDPAGENDALLLEVVDADGTTKLEGLSETGARVIERMASDRPVLGLVDNDYDGRKVSRNKRLDKAPCTFQRFENGVLQA